MRWSSMAWSTTSSGKRRWLLFVCSQYFKMRKPWLHSRRKNGVQMECVVYPMPGRVQVNSDSGAAYLREKAAMLRMIGEHVAQIREHLGSLARDINLRDTKSGTRIFVLMERGREGEFRAAVEQVATPQQLSRRISGPWPAAEFLSEQLRAPNAPK